jgi:hypothetical protein
MERGRDGRDDDYGNTVMRCDAMRCAALCSSLC